MLCILVLVLKEVCYECIKLRFLLKVLNSFSSQINEQIILCKIFQLEKYFQIFSNPRKDGI